MRSEVSAAPQGPVDILDILLAAPADTPAPGQEALVRLIRRAAAKDNPRSAAKAAPTPVRKDRASPAPRRPRKVKTTQYLDTAVHARLSAAKDSLDTAPGVKERGRVSKSRIVETALRQALDDFEAHGRDSRLGRSLQTALDEA